MHQESWTKIKTNKLDYGKRKENSLFCCRIRKEERGMRERERKREREKERESQSEKKKRGEWKRGG